MYLKTKHVRRWFLLACSFFLLLTSCSAPTNTSSPDIGEKPLRDNTSRILVPQASGSVIFEDERVAMDASNVSDGYIMVMYKADNNKVKLQISPPDANTSPYTYLLDNNRNYSVYPLTGGNGIYTITINEQVEGDMYAVIFSQDIDVNINDDFLPFLYPNVYVDFTSQCEAVQLGSTLAEGCYSDLEVIAKIYQYVVANISYDKEKASTVEYGYVPNINDTLTTKKGICFDYAALMSAMLRSQQIPTKLEVGFAGEVYHAWISCYVDEIGWVDNIIEFDGKTWTFMDPTFAASSNSSKNATFIGDGENYQVKFSY